MADDDVKSAKGKARLSSGTAKSQAAEQARNRENQRRLRERRKEYTEELERKVRALERQGVHATEAVQKAARLVVDENTLLRRLLHSHGVSSTAIDDYVRQGSMNFNITPTIVPKEKRPVLVPQAKVMPSDPATLLPLTSMAVPAEPRSIINPGSAFVDTVTSAIEPAATIRESRLSPSGYATNVAQKETSEIQDTTEQNASFSDKAAEMLPPAAAIGCGTGCGSPSVDSTPQRKCGVDEIDCEEAARIITSLRGGQDPQDVWPELGCSYTNRTSIKNALLMTLAG